MNRRLITVVTLAATTVGIYLASVSDRPVNAAGMRAATCAVRVSDECLAQYPALKRYETLRFPVIRDVSDGGLSFVLPRALGAADSLARVCIEVVDWGACDLDTCATFPATCASWDAGQPVTRVRSASKFVIPDCRTGGVWDDNHAPVDCLATGAFGLPDGGPRWAGCNVLPRASSTGAQCLDAPSHAVTAGERLEDSL